MGHFNRHDLSRNQFMLTGSFRRKGYDWWWHSFTGINEETGEEKAFFIEYFLCNPALSQDFPVFGQLPENKQNGKRPSYLMIKAGCWGKDARQIHRFFAWKDVKIYPKEPYAVQAKDCYASDFQLIGNVNVSREEAAIHPEYMTDAGSMSWELKLQKEVAFSVGYGAGKVCRALKAFEMYWHAEGMKTYYKGNVTLDGVKYRVEKDKCYGYADKNWGRGFTSPWVWLSSNDLYSKVTGQKLKNSVFDIGGGRPKVFFVPLERKLLGAFYYEGKEYEFNFSKFWTGTKTWFKVEEKENEIVWKVVQENSTHVMKTMVHCKKKDMLLINYEAPDGTKRHNRLWNGGNGKARIKLYEKTKNSKVLILIDDIEARHVGCEYGEYK